MRGIRELFGEIEASHNLDPEHYRPIAKSLGLEKNRMADIGHMLQGHDIVMPRAVGHSRAGQGQMFVDLQRRK